MSGRCRMIYVCWMQGDIWVKVQAGIWVKVQGDIWVHVKVKLKSSMARSLPVENLLLQNVGSIINYLQ